MAILRVHNAAPSPFGWAFLPLGFATAVISAIALASGQAWAGGMGLALGLGLTLGGPLVVALDRRRVEALTVIAGTWHGSVTQTDGEPRFTLSVTEPASGALPHREVRVRPVHGQWGAWEPLPSDGRVGATWQHAVPLHTPDHNDPEGWIGAVELRIVTLEGAVPKQIMDTWKTTDETSPWLRSSRRGPMAELDGGAASDETA